MTNKQKEIRGYVIAGILISAFILDALFPRLRNEYTREKELETGQTWVLDKNGNNISK